MRIPNLLLVLSFLLVLPLVAPRAGPPLIGDDPHAIGAGNVEVIVAGGGFGFADSDDLSLPIVDLTFGLLDGLDATLVAGPTFTWADAGGEVSTSGLLALGAKWQPLRGERWNAAFTPAVAIAPEQLDATLVVLPVQIEYAFGRSHVGVDAGYAVAVGDTDLWHAIVYGGHALSESWTLLGELWWNRSPVDFEPEVGFSMGFDWLFSPRTHLIAAGGTGIESFGGERVRWHAFVGLQWDITDAWSRGPAR